mgnify:CR=1 FL=1
MANGKKQAELGNNTTTENTAIENNTGAENISAPEKKLIEIVVKSPFYDTERHEPGEVLEVDETYFAELKEKDLATEREE